jgi:hypothetical protein
MDRSIRLLPALAGVVAASLGILVLYRGFPNEDAFILFKYVNNLASGLGIVYYAGGPHAEGATDFLWLVSLAALRVCGVDAAVGAVALNALGALLATALVCAAGSARARRDGWLVTIHLLFVAALLSGGGAFAAYQGFDALLYPALSLALFHVYCTAEEGSLCWIPSLGLLVGLVRPDGVILAVGFTLLGAAAAWRRDELLRYVAWSAAAATMGVAYFLWRLVYFEAWLPLPLYVKSHGAPFVRVGQTHAWLRSPFGPLPLLAGIALLALAFRTRLELRALRFLFAALPFLCLLFALSFANQIQNVGFRFQAPATLALLYVLCVLGASCLATSSSTSGRAAVVMIVLGGLAPGLWGGAHRVERLVESRYPSYVDVFAPTLRTHLQHGRVFALTEAGALAYWTDARVEDLIGLNSPRFAREPVTTEALREISPELILVHTSRTLDPEVLRRHADQPVAALPLADLAAAVRPRYRQLFEDGLRGYADTTLTPIEIAPVVVARFLVEDGGYDVFTIRFPRGRGHVYALRRGAGLEPLLAELRTSVDVANGKDWHRYRSYAAVQGFWLADAPIFRWRPRG